MFYFKKSKNLTKINLMKTYSLVESFLEFIIGIIELIYRNYEEKFFRSRFISDLEYAVNLILIL